MVAASAASSSVPAWEPEPSSGSAPRAVLSSRRHGPAPSTSLNTDRSPPERRSSPWSGTLISHAPSLALSHVSFAARAASGVS